MTWRGMMMMKMEFCSLRNYHQIPGSYCPNWRLVSGFVGYCVRIRDTWNVRWLKEICHLQTYVTLSFGDQGRQSVVEIEDIHLYILLVSLCFPPILTPPIFPFTLQLTELSPFREREGGRGLRERKEWMRRQRAGVKGKEGVWGEEGNKGRREECKGVCLQFLRRIDAPGRRN